MVKSLLIHSIIRKSLSNGPYSRYCIWFQGCNKRCKGCFNPETHTLNKGTIIEISEIIDDILIIKNEIKGITLTGGEPLLQIKGVIKLCKIIKSKTNLGIIILTGFTKEEMTSLKNYDSLIKYVDCIIYEPFIIEKRVSKGLIGSSNKKYLFITNRYNKNQIEKTPISEIIINQNGIIYISGINPSIFYKGYKNEV